MDPEEIAQRYGLESADDVAARYGLEPEDAEPVATGPEGAKPGMLPKAAPEESADLSPGELEQARASGAQVVGRRFQLPDIAFRGDRDYISTEAPTEVRLVRRARDVRRETPGLENLGSRVDEASDESIFGEALRSEPVRQVGRVAGALSPLSMVVGPEAAGDLGERALSEAAPVGRAGAAGAAQAMTLGFADELAGGFGALAGGDYEEERDRAREAMRSAVEAHPVRAMTGTVVGSAPLALLPGPTQLSAVRNAGALARVGASVGEGALFGGVGGYGASEAEGADALRDAGTGAAVGGALSGITTGTLEGAMALARQRAAASNLPVEANLARLRSLFDEDRPPRRLFREAVGLTQDTGEQIARRLQTIEQVGIKTADDAPRALQEMGDTMRGVAEQIDAQAPRGIRDQDTPVATLGFSIADRLRRKAAELRRSSGLSDSQVATLLGEAERWERAQADAPMDFRRAWDFRRQMNDPAHWTIGPRGEMARNRSLEREAYSIVREEMERAADQISPELGVQWREASRRYADLAPIASAANESRMRAIQNRQVGLTDTIAAGAGLQRGGALGAVSTWLANRAVRHYEHKIASTAYDLVYRLSQRNPAALGPYANALSNAARRGPGAFAAAFYQLWHRDPGFQQQAQSVTTQDEGAVPVGAEE